MPWGGSGKRRRAATPSPAAVGPPDPEAVRRQLAAEQDAVRRQREVFITGRVLPAVNRALRSAKFVTYNLGDLSINGSRTGVSVREVSGGTAWAVPLLEVLKQSPYTGYTVELKGVYRTGVSAYSRESRIRAETLDAGDIAASTKEFLGRHRGGYFKVTISL